MTAPHDHEVTPPPADQGVTGQVAQVILTTAAIHAAASAVAALLPGASVRGVFLALKLTDHDRKAHRGTKHAGRGYRSKGPVGDQMREEVFYRAAYVIAAAKRLSASLAAGNTPRAAVHRERGFWSRHEAARRARKQAAVNDQDSMHLWGPMLGWHAHQDDRTTPECRAADMTNYPAMKRPLIGRPGTLHGGSCRCTSGAPWPNGGSTDAATAHLLGVSV